MTGMAITCDSCGSNLTHSVRIKCAHPDCDVGDGTDICPLCFCQGKEFRNHKNDHPYRVIELPSYPAYTEDWGADEELMLIDAALQYGLGNWQAIAEHIGTRTKDDVEKHYKQVYIDSPDWPLPIQPKTFDISQEEFHRRKRRRIEEIPTINAQAIPKAAPTSAPGFHEVATFLPGRLEFEHEIDNDAEDLIKDLEFGLVYAFDGDKMPEDDQDLDIIAKRQRLERAHTPVNGDSFSQMDVDPTPAPNVANVPQDDSAAVNGDDKDKDEADAPHVPLPIETDESIAFKLTLLEMYLQRVEKRHEAKHFIFERGLLEYKKMQAAEKKRSREDKEIVHRLRPFAKLQTAKDYEDWVDGMLYEAMLRKRIAALQSYRRLGITTLSDADAFEAASAKRQQAKQNIGREYSYTERRGTLSIPRSSSLINEIGGRASSERDPTPQVNGAAVNGNVARPRIAQPLNLSNSPSLALLDPAEQTLCSQLRILPKPYLAIKHALVDAFNKSGGTLRKREARELVKIDVNKTARIWDFLEMKGLLRPPEIENREASGTVTQSQGGESSTTTLVEAPTLTRENSSQSQASSAMQGIIQTSPNKAAVEHLPST